MSIVDAYYYEDDKYWDLLEALFPNDGFFGEVEFSKFSMDSIDKIMECVSEIICNPKGRKEKLEDRVREKITCLPFGVRRHIERLFDNPDLLIYGHGGRADEILKSGKMYCKNADIGSHFISLEQTNESLEKLNNWPHKGCDKILIMGLNRREFNPIYKEDGDRYTISSDYFLGYYDNTFKRFVPNPKFKSEHNYVIGDEVEVELYPRDLGSYPLFSDQENFNQVLLNLATIGKLLTFSKIVPLDERGINNVRKQLLFKMNKTYEEAIKITPEVVSAYRNRSGEEASIQGGYDSSLNDMNLMLKDLGNSGNSLEDNKTKAS